MNEQHFHRSRFLLAVSFILFLTLVLAGCRGSQQAETPPPSPTSTAGETEPEAPEAVTEAFYAWYIGAVQAIQQGGREESVADLFHESSSLTPALVAKLDRNSGQGVDPVLFAQDLPQRISVELWEENANEACVVVHQEWSGSPTRDLTVDLVKENETWKLDDIRLGSPMTPDGVTRLFYGWYLEYINVGEQMRNPLVDGVYRDSEYLSAAFIAKVDEILSNKDGPAYDPILLAQDVPVGIDVMEPVVDGDQATVVVQRYFGGNPEPSPMTVHLEKNEERWQIVDATMDGPSTAMSPTQVVEAFYAWYLAYPGDPASEDFRNPLVDRAYRSAPYLSQALIEEVDLELEAGIHADLFLLAQDFPQGFEVQPGESEDLVLVNLFFGETVHPLRVRMTEENGQWLIRSITPVE